MHFIFQRKVHSIKIKTPQNNCTKETSAIVRERKCKINSIFASQSGDLFSALLGLKLVFFCLTYVCFVRLNYKDGFQLSLILLFFYQSSKLMSRMLPVVRTQAFFSVILLQHADSVRLDEYHMSTMLCRFLTGNL